MDTENIGGATATAQAIVDAAAQDKAKFGKYYPTIFVACGGTGAKVFERVRRHTLERFGGLEKKDLPGVAYVSIDTDAGSVRAGHQQDGAQTGVGINSLIDYRPEERITLDGSRIRHYVESQAALGSQPHIAEWFDPLLMETAKGMNISTGAGQIRPVARLVAWDNRERIVALFNRAYNEVISLSKDASRRVIGGSKVNVIICGSLAGGTGAGIFLDVAAMIRDAQPTVNITGMFVLPEVFATLDGEAKPKANGYACLAELNYYTTEPYRVNWEGTGRSVEIPVLYDRVYLFDKYNESGQAITRAGDTYDIMGDALFLDFFQGDFAFSRSSVQVNRAQVLLQIHKNRRELQPRRWVVQAGGQPAISSVEMESYRQRFLSMGLSRVAVPSWRILNRMSYWLAKQLIDFLDSRAELLADENKLKQEFANKLGFYQGEVTLDGATRRVYQVQSALMVLPSEGNAQASMTEAINLRFGDLTHPDAVDLWWKERNCGSELRRLWDAVGKDFAGMDDDGHKGAYIERILTNRRALFASVAQNLESVIDAFCERTDVGPHRIAQVMTRLVADIRNAEVFWIKEMEKRAEEQATFAASYKVDWEKWSRQAAEADTSFLARINQNSFKEQLKKAQSAAQSYWNALINRKIYLEAAGFLRDVARLLEKEGIEKQELLALRLSEMRNSFEGFDGEYAKARRSPVFFEFDIDDAKGMEELRSQYLGETKDKQHESLRTLFERTKAHLGIRTNRELRERIETDKGKFIRDFRSCCWMALRGTDGKTDWFGAQRDGFIESYSVLDHLIKRFGSPTHPQLIELAQETFKKAMPWVKQYDGVKVDGVVRDCYVVLPKATRQNQAVADEFFKAVNAVASGYPGMNVARVAGTEQSEILVVVETSGLIPASVSTLHGQSGLYESYRQLAATRKQQNIKSFLHLDRDVARFPLLLPMKPTDADKVVSSWRLFLLGVILGVIRTKRNPVRVDPMEQSIFPVFMYTYDTPGINEVVELGQWQSAVSDIADNSNLQSRLSEMVNRQYVQQPASRYERILALVRYYKHCIFPVKKARPDEGHDQKPRATLAYMALDQIEQEVLTQWQEADRGTTESVHEMMSHRVPELLWNIEDFALHVGQEDHGAALCKGLEDDEYVEQPPAREHDQEKNEVVRRRELRDVSYNLLPASLRANPALRERSQYYPWLRLAPRYRIYFPSEYGGALPDPSSPAHLTKLKDLSVREAVKALLASPRDSNEKHGARFWHHPVGRVRGEYVEWTKIQSLKEEYLRGGGAMDTSPPMPAMPGAGLATPPLPGASGGTRLIYASPGAAQPIELSVAEIAARVAANRAGQHFVLVNNAWVEAAAHPEIRSQLPQQPPPIGGASFYYVGPTVLQPAQLSIAAIVEHIRANPTGNHMVVVNNAWASALSVPEIKAAQTPIPPLPGAPGLPPLPGVPGLPPPPAQLPPIPSGPFQYVGAGFTTWTLLSGEQVVAAALSQPSGSEGHIVYNNAAAPVMSVSELAAAITARRKQ